MLSSRVGQGGRLRCRRRPLDAGIGALLLVLSLAWSSLTLARTFDLRDEGFILFESARAAAGEVPHRDFTAIYGPGFFLVNGLMLRFFDGSMLALRILLALLKSGAVVLTFLLARRFAPRGFALFGALLSMLYWGRWSWNLNTPYAALYTIPLCMLAVCVLIRALVRDSARDYVVAGFVAGAAVLFKQSLGLANAYGMILAICAVCALETAPGRRSRSSTATALTLWTLAAVAIMAPFTTWIGSRDYLVHFLPLHLLMASVAIGVLLRGGIGSLRPGLGARLWPFSLGLVALPISTAIVYAHWGSLDELVFDMFVFPRSLENYAIAVPLAPLSLWTLVCGAIALLSSGLCALGRRRRAGTALAIFGLGLMGAAGYALPLGELQTLYDVDFPTAIAAGHSLYSVETLRHLGKYLEGVEAPIIAIGALLAFAPAFLRKGDGGCPRALRVAIPLIFFQTLMCFQVFPRATYNVWLVQGASMPLLALVLFRWYQLGVSPGSRAWQRISAAVLTALIPIWLVQPVGGEALSARGKTMRWRSLAAPRAAGIELDTFQYRFNHIDEFERLVAFLRSESPDDAPLLLLTNEAMILYSSGRPTLFPERAFHLSLLGWGMLPEAQRRALDEAAMLVRLQGAPEALVILRLDRWSARMRASLPRLDEFIGGHYAAVKQIGGYRVLKRSAR